MKLWTTPEYDRLSLDELLPLVNGCGPATCKYCSRFLNNAMGVHVFDACAQHDIDHAVGGDEKARRESNIRFICNLMVIALSHPSRINIIRVPYLFGYYLAVHYGSRKHFNYRR